MDEIKSTFNFSGILVDFCQLFWQISIFQKLSIFSFFENLNSFSVSSFVSFEDSNNPLITSESFSVIVKLIIFITWINISNSIITFGFTHGSINLPGSVIRKLVHETVLHGWQNLVVDSISISSYVVLLFNVWIYTTSDSDHP